MSYVNVLVNGYYKSQLCLNGIYNVLYQIWKGYKWIFLVLGLFMNETCTDLFLYVISFCKVTFFFFLQQNLWSSGTSALQKLLEQQKCHRQNDPHWTANQDEPPVRRQWSILQWAVLWLVNRCHVSVTYCLSAFLFLPKQSSCLLYIYPLPSQMYTRCLLVALKMIVIHV